jgi:predicted nuclease of predicted toxin-antitoxin system
MKCKLDENFGLRCVEILTAAGHDVSTVAGQGMSGATDKALIEACRLEERCLVSLDLDFANPLRFPPANCHGIVVVRLPGRMSHSRLVGAMQTLVRALKAEAIAGKLWIVEIDRIRIYQGDGD